MELLILRHAIAFPRDPGRWPDDGERPLTTEGVRKARRAASGLKDIIGRPALLLTSPLVRARATAAIFEQAARWPKALACNELTPGRNPEDLLTMLRRRGSKAECIAIVGHQPHLGRLLALCLRGEALADAFDLRKSGIACVRFEGPPRAGRGVLSALLPPRMLRKI
jgi:phosphohistidine phosphatase